VISTGTNSTPVIISNSEPLHVATATGTAGSHVDLAGIGLGVGDKLRNILTGSDGWTSSTPKARLMLATGAIRGRNYNRDLCRSNRSSIDVVIQERVTVGAALATCRSRCSSRRPAGFRQRMLTETLPRAIARLAWRECCRARRREANEETARAVRINPARARTSETRQRTPASCRKRRRMIMVIITVRLRNRVRRVWRQAVLAFLDFISWTAAFVDTLRRVNFQAANMALAWRRRRITGTIIITEHHYGHHHDHSTRASFGTAVRIATVLNVPSSPLKQSRVVAHRGAIGPAQCRRCIGAAPGGSHAIYKPPNERYTYGFRSSRSSRP